MTSRAEAIRQVLVEAAAERRTISYAQLLAAAGEPPEGVDDLAQLLRAISIDSDDGGHGLLSAIVVRAESGLPGAGFFRLAAERGRDVTDRRAMWEAEVARVLAAYSPPRERL